MPRISLVRSLNGETNAPMFPPCWPSAGPTGGAGVACPPVTCSRTCAVTCRAMALPFLLLLHLPVFQLDRHRPAEDRQLHAHPAHGLEDLLDLPLHALEGAVDHLHPVARVELGPAPDLLRGLVPPGGANHPVDLALRHRRRWPGHRPAHEVPHPRRLPEQVEDAVV